MNLESFDFDINKYKIEDNSSKTKKKKRKYYPLYENYDNGSEKYYKRIVDEDPVWDGTRIFFMNDTGYLSYLMKHPLLKKFQNIDCTVFESKNTSKLDIDFAKFKPDIIVAVGKSAPFALKLNDKIPVVLVDPEGFFMDEERKSIILNSKRDIYDQLRTIIDFIETDVSPDKYPLYAF